MTHDLRVLLRWLQDPADQPTAAILDSRTLRSTPESGHRRSTECGRGQNRHRQPDQVLDRLHLAPDDLRRDLHDFRAPVEGVDVRIFVAVEEGRGVIPHRPGRVAVKVERDHDQDRRPHPRPQLRQQCPFQIVDAVGGAGRTAWSRASLDSASVPAKRGARRSAPIPPITASQARNGT